MSYGSMKVTQMPPVHAANLVANSGNTAYGVDVILWLLMAWCCKESGHQHPWYRSSLSGTKWLTFCKWQVHLLERKYVILIQIWVMFALYGNGVVQKLLTHWSRDKLATIFQKTLSNAFSWMKMYIFRLRFHWCLSAWVQSTLFQYWFR